MAPPPAELSLVVPARQHLSSFVAALNAGWSPDNLRGSKAGDEALAQIAEDADRYLALRIDREAKGPPITLPDGTQVQRLPGLVLWMWDGEFCGTIGLRWQRGTPALPPHVLGHIGYGVVPWKRQRGYAKRALGLMLVEAAKEGLPYVELTCDVDNEPSQRTIVANGGVLIERFQPLPAYGDAPKLRYRVQLIASPERP
jgi:predicted acetyltransferase